MATSFFTSELGRLSSVCTAAVLGICMAIYGLLEMPSLNPSLVTKAVAEVNGKPIEKAAYLKALSTLSFDKKQVSADDQEWVLQRLIEEELLVQRSLEIDLSRNHKAVRSVLLRAMLDSVIKDVDAKLPSDEELKQYYAAKAELFRPTPRFKVRAWYINAGKTEAVWELPNSFLNREKLREYLGPKAVTVLAKMEVGQTSSVSLVNRQLHLTLVDRRQDPLPVLEDVSELVLDEYRREATDRALRDYLNWLMARANVKRTDLDVMDQ